MAKPEWGVKRLCPSCAARFYDLMRTPVVCPSCGATVDVTAPLRGRAKPGKPLPEDKAAKLHDEDALEDVADFGDAEDEDVLDIDEDEDDPAAPVMPRGESKKRVHDDDMDGFQVIDPDAER